MLISYLLNDIILDQNTYTVCSHNYWVARFIRAYPLPLDKTILTHMVKLIKIFTIQNSNKNILNGKKIKMSEKDVISRHTCMFRPSKKVRYIVFFFV